MATLLNTTALGPGVPPSSGYGPLVDPITGALALFLATYSDGTQVVVDSTGKAVPGAKVTTIQQAEGLFNAGIAPASSNGNTGVIIDPYPQGTTFSPGALSTAQAKSAGVDAATGAPVAAVLSLDQVSTTSKQSGDNPGPIPPVGMFPPQVNTQPPEMSVAPGSKSNWKQLAVVFAVLIGLWFFAGWSFGRRLML